MRFLTATIILLTSSNALADTKLNVVSSIKPVHSLVSGVMAGVGKPELLLEGASSPHDFNLKPSQAELLQESDLVFWIGHSLEGFLEKPMETIGTNATSVELIETPGLIRLKFRESDEFEAHEHDDAESEKDHDKHAEGKDEHHSDEHSESHEKHEEHADEKDEHEHDDHAHEGEFNPHVWLDPQNAVLMVAKIRDALKKADGENAETYSKNATKLTMQLEALDMEIAEKMKSAAGKPFIVFHDAYPYFENRYKISAAGSITINPENAPGAKRVKELQEKVKNLKVTCVFSEPQFNPKLVTLVTQNTSANTAILDPLGSSFDAGEYLYFKMMNGLANSFEDCLG